MPLISMLKNDENDMSIQRQLKKKKGEPLTYPNPHLFLLLSPKILQQLFKFSLTPRPSM